MDIKEKQRLAEKQKFWAEQLPNFEAKYWLPSHFAVLVFDMTQGNYVIKDGIHPDFEDDAAEIYHRVNTGWAMWKKAITFSQKQAQAVPQWISVNDKLPPANILVLGMSQTPRNIFNIYNVMALDEFEEADVTHWMPLPDAPQEST